MNTIFNKHILTLNPSASMLDKELSQIPSESTGPRIQSGTWPIRLDCIARDQCVLAKNATYDGNLNLFWIAAFTDCTINLPVETDNLNDVFGQTAADLVTWTTQNEVMVLNVYSRYWVDNDNHTQVMLATVTRMPIPTEEEIKNIANTFMARHNPAS
jgi:hypothetical protein